MIKHLQPLDIAADKTVEARYGADAGPLCSLLTPLHLWRASINSYPSGLVYQRNIGQELSLVVVLEKGLYFFCV